MDVLFGYSVFTIYHYFEIHDMLLIELGSMLPEILKHSKNTNHICKTQSI